MLNLKGFFIAVLIATMSLSISAKAEDPVNTESAEYLAAQAQIDAALATGDADLIASAVSKAIQDNPSFAGQLVSYAVSKNPSAAPAVVAAVSTSAPDQADNIVANVTKQLQDSNAGADIIAKVASQAKTAAGGNNNNQGGENNGNAFGRGNAQGNGQNNGNGQKNGFTENPNQTSDN